MTSRLVTINKNTFSALKYHIVCHWKGNGLGFTKKQGQGRFLKYKQFFCNKTRRSSGETKKRENNKKTSLTQYSKRSYRYHKNVEENGFQGSICILYL